MKKILLAASLVVGISGVSVFAQEAKSPEMPKPQKEHEWLNQLVGEWEYEAEITMDPSKPPVKTKGTEICRSIGGYWTVCESKGDFMGQPFTGMLTLGFSPHKSKYVGSWVGSMDATHWNYEGTLDEGKNTLTLGSEGPCPMQGGKIVKVQEIVEIKDANHRVFKSQVEQDGKLVPGMTITYTRKK